jgi:AraC-like DNA-binding protein
MLRTYKVHPRLQSFVSRIRLIHYQFEPQLPQPVNPFPPQPEHSLYFYLYDKVVCENVQQNFTAALPSSTVVGPQLSLVNLRMGHHTMIIHVGFWPGGLHRLLQIPMIELEGRAYDSTLFFNNEINEVIARLYDEPDDNQKVDIVQQMLLKKATKLTRTYPVDLALRSLILNCQISNIKTLASDACVSIRQLERQCYTRVGMSPKTFAKLVRFSRAWNLRERNQTLSWNSIAHHCSYADQMHMIRDFKMFTGKAPSNLEKDLEISPIRLQAE